MDNCITNENMIRIVILDISKPLASEVYDETILPTSKATDFIKNYINMDKYRILTV